MKLKASKIKCAPLSLVNVITNVYDRDVLAVEMKYEHSEYRGANLM